ncbi:hypothetical protein ACE1CI_35385 [Aerosakkonemataceae cyanobacterium BLCC-F50]|uniref:Uncharacterized protein n=1 Tax=Floridaenema flaviceps BLCC-F50 TaxID=3153642 RepID=A0ABV4Y2Q8_9CYAN
MQIFMCYMARFIMYSRAFHNARPIAPNMKRRKKVEKGGSFLNFCKV